MAETASAICFSIITSSLSFYTEPVSSVSVSLGPRRFGFLSQRLTSTSLRSAFRVSGSAHFPGDDDFGLYPWENSDNALQWVPGERVTLFTSDGLIQIGGNLVPRRVSSSGKKELKGKMSSRSLRFKESNYMDPSQTLCIGALFDIAATNGHDTGRRLCIFGFCRSIEMLCDVVEDTVLEHGGEVVAAEKESKGGLHEKLTMTVAVPLLWGIPPASETLRFAVKSGGGIVDKLFWQWDFL